MDVLAWVEISVFSLGLLTAVIGTLAMLIFKQIAGDIRRMANNIGELNTHVAVILEKQNSHDRRLEVLEGRRG